MIEEVAVPALAVFAATVAKKSAEAPAHTLNLLWKVTLGDGIHLWNTKSEKT